MKENVLAHAESVIKNHEGVFLVELAFVNEADTLMIDLFVDTDEGITLDRCAKISRELSNLLEEEDLISSAYNVMVSSPGLTRAMTHPRQFKKSVGRELTIEFADEKETQNNGDYTLEAYNEAADELQLLAKNKSKSVKREQIKSATIKLKW